MWGWERPVRKTGVTQSLERFMRLRFTEAIKRTETIKTFRFSCDEKFDFLPGQFTQLVFDEENKQSRDLNKYLSFSCAPGKGYIEVTKRISESGFSRRLSSLKPGDTVLFKPPMGNCVFRDDYKKVTFLIGGIGITPVISMIEYIVEKKIDTDIYLLYSNRSIEDIAFKKELDLWKEQNPNIHIVYTAGRINKDMVTQYMPDFEERIVFMFGAPAMVDVMKSICFDIGCSKDNVMAENFIGY